LEETSKKLNGAPSAREKMKQPNPLVPQGSFEAHARGKSQVRLAVFTILTIHVVVLGALLIHGAGCKRTETDAEAGATNDLATTPPFSSTTDPVSSAPAEPSASNPPPIPSGTGVITPPPTFAQTSAPPPTLPPPVVTPPTTVPPPVAPVEPTPSGSEHVIVRGDTFAGLAAKYGVTVRAIQAANPGVDPARLKVGQKVTIPPKTTTAATSSGNGGAANGVYVVKSGDTLGKIATAHGTTVRSIQKLNNLVTTQIRVGQKLKMPPKGAAAAKSTPNPATPGGTPAGDFTVPPPVPPAPAQ
jgi:LysM repeat protein